MRKYGLIGYPLGHSYSAAYFKKKFSELKITNCSYENWPLASIGDLEQLLTDGEIRGFNVTIPYKTEVLKYVELVDDSVFTSAVNTVKIGSVIKGFNTDGSAFEATLQNVATRFMNAGLILGTGGSASVVSAVLSKRGLKVTHVSRSGDKGTIHYRDITPSFLKDYTFIVNCTPVGMFPYTDSCPALPYKALGKEHFLYDLIYNPAETRFLAEGRKRGCGTMNGLEMLYRQANGAWEIWNRDE